MPTCSSGAVKPSAGGRRGSYWPQSEVGPSKQHKSTSNGKYVNRIKLISAPSNVASTVGSCLEVKPASCCADQTLRPSTPALHQEGEEEEEAIQQEAEFKKLRIIKLSNAKLLLIALTGLDLLISVLVYQFAQEDQVNVFKQPIRLSLINLLTSGLWFIVFAAALLYHLKPILKASILLHLASFLLLLYLSILHLTRRIDYQLVHLSRLLFLLFLLTLLHLYLLAMASLTLYLVLALGRRSSKTLQ